MLLEVKEITKNFGGLRALHDINFEVMKGEVLALIGPNGAGKTTLLNIISGVYKATKGKVIFCGKDLSRCSAHEISQLGIARTFQLVKMISEMTIMENVMVGNHRHGKATPFEIILRTARFYREEDDMAKTSYEALDFVNLGNLAHNFPSTLSYGQQRMVEVARAFASKPILLLLDEPAAGLNNAEVERFKELVKAIKNAEITIILVEHNMRLVDGVSDRVVVLNYGEKIAQGSFNEIRKDERVVKAYLGRAQK